MWHVLTFALGQASQIVCHILAIIGAIIIQKEKLRKCENERRNLDAFL